ncbi:MAG: response regulator [Planctomycetota bacterium]|nr:response regulator [Planctomycetota bacterium]
MTTVLVVDDSPLDRKIAGDILEAEGMTVTYAADGQEALDQMAKEKPDLVLTDLQMPVMPVMDGLELVRQIKKRYPATPVILVTRAGSEEIAAEALHIGASSYVPKRNMKRDLGRVLEMVLTALETLHEREQIRNLLQQSESYYVLGYGRGAPKALINHLQDSLVHASVGDEMDRLRIGTALAEALANAIDHGNLELDSKLREEDMMTYRAQGIERVNQEPYRHRKVHVTARLKPGEATFIVRDEGPGFNPGQLPDPTDPENLLKPSGRGVMLIRTFMDHVSFNETGNEITMVKRSGS